MSQRATASFWDLIHSDYRAKPGDWRYVHQRTADSSETCGCILELHSRLQRLEAAANREPAAVRTLTDYALSLLPENAAVITLTHDQIKTIRAALLETQP